MADIKIAKIKIRRGLDADRKTVIFDQGEPVYSQDTDRLYSFFRKPLRILFYLRF